MGICLAGSLENNIVNYLLKCAWLVNLGYLYLDNIKTNIWNVNINSDYQLKLISISLVLFLH